MWYRILIKTAFVFWAKQKLSKTTSSRFQKCLFELWWACCFGCKWKNCFEKFLRSHYLGTVRVFHSNTESRFGCASSRRLRLVLWIFSTCVWDVLWYRILIKTAFVFWAKQQLSKTTLSTFQKCLFELWWACCFGYKWKNCFEKFLRSHYLGTVRVFHSNTESRFVCASCRRLRLVLWLFTSCVWVVLGYRIHIKTAFVSWAKQKLSKTTSSTFQKCFFELCSAWFFGCKWKNCFENFLRSLYLGKIRVFHSNTESCFVCASSRRLRLVLWIFSTCVWDVLWYRILIKKAFVFWAKQKLSKTTSSTFQKCLFELWWACCFGCKWKICFEKFLRSHYLGTVRVFHSNTESRFGCASSRRLRLVLWIFSTCVWDVLWYRILIKTASVFWAKQQLSKTTLSTFQKYLFELWWACCFGCN